MDKMMKPKTEPNWKRMIIGGCVLIAVLFAAASLMMMYSHAHERGDRFSFPVMGKRLALVRLEGPIFRSEGTVDLLEKCAENDKIRGVLLRVNSPGGGVVASQEIYAAVARLSESGKPVVVSMGSAGASGAYYIASAADYIVCNPGTLTGSIGVLASFLQAEELLGKIGLGFKTIKSGEYKSLGDYSREMTEREERLFQAAIDDIFAQFVSDVLEGRREQLRTHLAAKKGLRGEDISDDMLRRHIMAYADGRILTGNQAFDLGFVDELGDFKCAVKVAGEKAGIKGEPWLLEMQRKRGALEDFMGGAMKRIILGVLWEARLPALLPGAGLRESERNR